MDLIGSYGIPYDPSAALARLKDNRADAIAELWENLYHEGTVGTASFSAVTQLVAQGELVLVGAIEVARKERHNPSVPWSMVSDYETALDTALSLTPRDEEQYQGYYVIHASVHGQIKLAKALNLLCLDDV